VPLISNPGCNNKLSHSLNYASDLQSNKQIRITYNYACREDKKCLVVVGRFSVNLDAKIPQGITSLALDHIDKDLFPRTTDTKQSLIGSIAALQCLDEINSYYPKSLSKDSNVTNGKLT